MFYCCLQSMSKTIECRLQTADCVAIWGSKTGVTVKNDVRNTVDVTELIRI